MSVAPGKSKEREQKTWDRLEELEQKAGLNVSEAFDRIETDSSLPTNVPAATKFDDYQLMIGELIDEEPEALLKLNDTFFYLDPGKQDEVLFHESMHGLEGKDRLMPELRYRKGISKEFEDDLVTAFSYGGIDSTEGIVQALAAELNDSNVGDYFRRYETRDTRDRWRNKGLDPESELAGEIEEFRRDVIDEDAGREIYGVEAEEGLYFEYGEFLGEDYSIAVSGEGAEVYGKEVADQYLGDLYEGLDEVEVEELDFEQYQDGYGAVDLDEDFLPDRAVEDFEDDYEDEYEDAEEFAEELAPEPVGPEQK
ncbi:hypothetical protein AQV86_04440 [Nanohaloarchaea archaeon SG9]|nr:hypothetical protein AQV86_04440 [Nanohaloarchaea archaeon SG9]